MTGHQRQGALPPHQRTQPLPRRQIVGILCGAGGMLLLDGSFAVSSLLVDTPFFASQALRYLLGAIALGLIAHRPGPPAPRPTLAELGWLAAVALTGLV